MNWPSGFDPKQATEVVYNGCYFNVEDWPAVVERLRELFPSASIVQMMFDDLPDRSIMRIEPHSLLGEAAFEALHEELNAILPAAGGPPPLPPADSLIPEDGSD